jgi:hypothetical protein
LPKKTEAENLHSNYTKPARSLILGYYRLDDARILMKNGEVAKARQLTGYIKHYIHDALGLLDLTEDEIENQKPKPWKPRKRKTT